MLNIVPVIINFNISVLIQFLLIPVYALLLYILLVVVSAFFVDTTKEHKKDNPYFRWLITSSAALMTFFLNIRVHTTGKEKVPDEHFVLVSNHRSNFDPILQWLVLRKGKLAYISKPENFNVPGYGRFIRKCCFLSIDRNDPRNSFEVFNKAIDLLKSGEVSIGVYPEGTRSKQCVLLPFHSGVFKIPQKANVPLVVMTVTGTEQIHKNTPFKRTNVHLDIIDVIPAEHINDMRTNDLCEMVRQEIADHLKELG